MDTCSFLPKQLPARQQRPWRTRAGLAVLGLCVGITAALAGTASAQVPSSSPNSKPPSLGPNQQMSITTTTAGTPTTLSPGQSTVVTVTASRDVGPTPFFIRIFDNTTSSLIQTCGFGATCSVSVSQPQPTTHIFFGRITTADLRNVLAGSDSNQAYVTWNAVWRLSLRANPAPLAARSTILTATANRSVSSTPFSIAIFREDGPNHIAGTLLARCTSGATCTVGDVPSRLGTDYVAFVAPASAGPPPLGSIQASSNVVRVALGSG